MALIFISYRRGDITSGAERLARELEPCFGPGSVYLDIRSGLGGEDFWARIREELDDAAVVLLLPTDHWLEGIRAVESYARRELERALELRKRLIPIVLGDGLRWPEPESLPPDVDRLVAPLRTLQYVRVRPGTDHERDCDLLAGRIGELVGNAPASGSRSAAAAERALDDCLTLLRSGAAERAAACVAEVLRRYPGDPRGNLYLAVARLIERKLGFLPQRVVQEVESALVLAAAARDPCVAATARWMAALVKHDYYFHNGLPTSPTFFEMRAQLGSANLRDVDLGLAALLDGSPRVRALLPNHLTPDL